MHKPTVKPVYFALVIFLIFVVLLTIGTLRKPAIMKDSSRQKNQNVTRLDSNRLAIILRQERIIYPDDYHTDTIAVEDGIDILKLSDTVIAYRVPAQWGMRPLKKGDYDAVNNNMLINPAAGKIVLLILSDDTKVWIRPGSRLSFANIFYRGSRYVSLEGEAYFEVKGREVPFEVSMQPSGIDGQRRRIVSGAARFNLNGFKDQAFFTATSLEGLLKIYPSNWNTAKLIGPMEEAILSTDTSIHADNLKIIKDADTARAIAWRK